MPNNVISKSRYITGFRCRYASFLGMTKPHLAEPIENELMLTNGREFNDAAVKFMGATTTIMFSTDKNKMVEDTKKAIEDGHRIIGDASFMVDGMFCSVDIFKINDDETISINEVKSSSEIKEVHEFDIAFQYVILTKLGYNVKEAFLVYANKDYSFKKGESVDFSELFVNKNIIERCKELVPIIEDDVRIIANAVESDVAPEHDFSSSCNAPYKCPFFEHCIEKDGMPKDANIFNITGPQFVATKLNKWYLNGIKTYQDIVDNVKVTYKKDGTPKDANWKYVQQAQTYLNKQDAPIEMEKLGKFLDTIKYPIGSFDYEGFETVVPRYSDLKPSQQVVFQFSYDYIEYEGAERQHYDFLVDCNSKEDPRMAVCKALSKLPVANSILVWNKTYEKTRNEEMAQIEWLSEYKDVLLTMVNNFVDIMAPFRERVIVPWKANGSYSLKPITEALIPNLQYKDLKVHNGVEAAVQFLNLPNMDEENRKKTITAMKFYNNQDTYGPLKILEKMYRIYRGDDNFVLFTEKTMKDVLKNDIHIGDTVTCNRGIGAVTKMSETYATIMLMDSGEEIRRMGKSLVLIQELVTDKPRNVKVGGKLEHNDLVTCNRGIGKVYGFTKCFVRVKLKGGTEILRAHHNLIRIQCFVD